ncbi:hypothetical protein KQH49_13390 [Mycetohabitans sp. B5]|nr:MULTISPECIES: hypothetical protein [Mycetohabitans]MCG1055865.1 hypothetical protein [Mycetohabitans sp. B5]
MQTADRLPKIGWLAAVGAGTVLLGALADTREETVEHAGRDMICKNSVWV